VSEVSRVHVHASPSATSRCCCCCRAASCWPRLALVGHAVSTGGKDSLRKQEAQVWYRYPAADPLTSMGSVIPPRSLCRRHSGRASRDAGTTKTANPGPGTRYGVHCLAPAPVATHVRFVDSLHLRGDLQSRGGGVADGGCAAARWGGRGT
jgi:hypothetical protein